LKLPAKRTRASHLSRQISGSIKRFGNINWALADQAMLSGVNFFTGILLARYLGVTEFGIFTLAWLIVEFVQGIQYSLIIMPMISIGPKQSEHARLDYLGSVMLQQVGFAVLSSVLFLTGVWTADHFFPDWGLGELIWPLALALLVSQFQNFARRYFFAFRRSAVAFLVDFVRYAGQIAILFWLLLTVNMNAAGALWVIVGTSLASTVLAVFFVEKVKWNRENFHITLVRHWAFSKWLMLSELMRWATGNFYMFVAGGMIGAAGVGAIRATQNLVGMSHILMLGLENVVPAGAARRLSKSGKQAFLRYLMLMMLFGASIVGTIVVVASAAPEFWLDLIYGKDYVGYGHLVVWWSVIYFIAFLAQQLSIGLRTIERTKSIFWAHLVTAIISVASVYPLIAYFGMVGVMIGLLMIVVIRIAILAVSFFYHLRKLKN
jgi:O-antigen/teichoic acid export membrane protein